MVEAARKRFLAHWIRSDARELDKTSFRYYALMKKARTLEDEANERMVELGLESRMVEVEVIRTGM
jgi:hypothetical protein